MCHQPPGTDVGITFKSSLMRGRFRFYQSRRLAVGRDPRSETRFQTLYLRTFLSLILSSHKHLPLVLALFQMANNGWIGGICFAEPGLPKLLILSLETHWDVGTQTEEEEPEETH